MAQNQQNMHKPKSAKAKIAVSAAAGAVLWLAAAGVLALFLKSGGQEIAPKQTVTTTAETSAPVPVLDKEIIKRSFAYVDINELSPDDSLLTVSKSNVPPAKLQPVYNAVFSKDGLQIVSLADSRLKCRSEAIVPLSEMLDAFYTETKLRTLMINDAFEPYSPPPEPQYTTDENGNTVEVPNPEAQKCAEHNNGYSFDFGIYIKEDDSRRVFTLEGQYSWFSKHSWEYGFIQRYPSGAEELTGKPVIDDHFRYVGKLAAGIMNENSLCYEQLDGFLSAYTIDDPLILEDDTVVYVYKLGSEREVPVPAVKDGSHVPCEVYYLGKGQKKVLIAAKPSEEFYSMPSETAAETEAPAETPDTAETSEQ